MASIVFTDAFVSWGGVDISAYVRGVTLTYSRELLDDTAMGDTTRSRVGGLYNWSASAEFFSDEAASATAQTLFGQVGVVATLLIRPVKATVVGTTNPNYTGSGIVERFQPVGGEVGSISMSPLSVQSAGALSRATS